MKYLIILLYICCLSNVYAQKEDHQWLFNWTRIDDCSLWPDTLPDVCGATVLDFNSLPPIAYKDTAITLDVKECSSTICDLDGQLMLYTNAQSVHGAEHQPIINGDTINFGPRWDWLTWENEHGEVKPSGYRIPQGALFVPIPESKQDYLLLYENYELRDSNDRRDAIWMAQITQNDDGRFEIDYKDSLLIERVYTRGKLTACRHGNGRDWWLLQFNVDTVYTYLIDPNGIQLNHLQFLPFELHDNLGQAKYSPDGSKFALYGEYGEGNAEILVSDFDRCTGGIFNAKYFFRNEAECIGSIQNGLEFSPSGRLLYRTVPDKIYQYDLQQEDIFDTEIIVARDNGFLNELSGRPSFFGPLQLAPDNKIYISFHGQGNDMHVINHPDRLGSACDVQQDIIPIPSFHIGTMPALNTYRLGPMDDSACDTLGIDNHPVSRFWFEQDTLDFLTSQFWDVSYFRSESWTWEFGDGNSSSERHPMHTYDEKGVYEVCLTVGNENSEHTSCDTLFLGVSSINNHAINMGISYFPNPTEGPIRFVLSNYLPVDGRLIIYDCNGRELLIKKMNHGATTINLVGKTPGVYYYQLLDGNKTLDSGKIVKQ